MNFYDTSVVVDYKNDDEYRTCLLAAFQLKAYDEEIIQRIETLCTEVNSAELEDKAKVLSRGMQPEFGKLLLFSYDEFKTTHRIIQSKK